MVIKMSNDVTKQTRNFRENLILKEMEIAHSSIKNLDDIIHRTKNFAFLTWGGSLALLVKFVSDPLNHRSGMHWLILLTGLVPLLFWSMDYWWRKHLRMASRREKRLSLFINSKDLEEQLNGKPTTGKFPLHDHIGWIYTKQGLENNEIPHGFAEEYLGDKKEFGIMEILFYKDAWFYYLGMLVISVLFLYIGFKP